LTREAKHRRLLIYKNIKNATMAIAMKVQISTMVVVALAANLPTQGMFRHVCATEAFLYFDFHPPRLHLVCHSKNPFAGRPTQRGSYAV
jgi:hypothetical protein